MAECTIYDKLRYIAETKDLIKAAIEAQDVEVLESATFRQYAEYITQIRKVSSVNGMQGDVTITAEDLGALTAIPSEYITETELNEKGYLTAVPDVYITEDELSSQLADKVSQNGLNEAIDGVRNDIPTNVSELTNDSGYITLNEVPKVDLSGYALKSEIPDISVKQDKLTAGNGISITDNVISLDYEYDLFEVVQSLPTENISDNKVYLLLDSNGSEGNTYVEYLYVNGQWEELGKFKVNIDLSGYATEEWVNSQGFLKEHQDISNLATKSELATKQDTINDLETIRSGAALGATALQSVPDTYATEQWVNEQGFLKEHQDISNLATKQELATKQDVISDLDTIRSGAAKGETALQSVPSTYAKKTDILSAKTDTRYTTFDVQNPVLSGKTILLQNEATDSRKYHTFGYEKTITASVPVQKYINITRNYNGVPSMDTDIESGISFDYNEEYDVGHMYGDIPFTLDKINAVTNLLHYEVSYADNSGETIVDDVIYDPNTKLLSVSDGRFSFAQIRKSDNGQHIFGGNTDGNEYLENGRWYYNFEQHPLQEGVHLIFEPYYSSNLFWNFSLTLNGIFYQESSVTTDDKPERLNDYIRYANNVKAYILTDKNTTFKTINGEQITGDGDITIDTNVDLSNYATKSELNTKQDVINDLETIRSGAALGATALQSVPDTYALKSDILSAKTDERYTDYDVQNPVLSGNTIVLQNEVTDSRKYHTLGFDKTAETTEIGQVIKYSRFNREFDSIGNPIIDTNFDNNQNIPLDFSHITDDGDQIIIHYTGSFANNDYETGTSTEGDSFEATITYNRNTKQLNASDNGDVTIYHFTRSDTGEYIFDQGNKQFDGWMLPDGAYLIWNIGNMSSPLYYRYNVSTQGNLFVGETTTTSPTSRLPQNKNEFFRYENDVKAYILTDKNTTFKTINGQQITGDGDITIDTNVDLSNYATKSELYTKQNLITDLETIRSGAAKGATALQSVPSEYATEQWVNSQGFLKEHQDISNLATKSELNAKQDVISDLDSIRSGAALGATALQSVPDTYALKSEIPDITTKQDTLVSGTNIKTINGASLLGSGDITIDTNVDLSGYATEQWVNEQGFLKEHQDISNLATKEELNTKQDTINDLETIRSGAALGSTALQSVPDTYATEEWVNSQGFLKEHQDISNLATKDELNAKQDVISDLQTIRSGAAKGETALQSVPSEYVTETELNNKGYLTSVPDTYALKSEIPDITTKQDTLVSGTNIKTINGNSLLGSGDITIEGGSGNVDLTDYYTKTETNELVNPKLEQITLTQAEYDALQTKENNVLYIISDAEDLKFTTINGQQILGEGNIEIKASADNVPTLQTTPQGTTSNYIYSSGQDNKYGVISDITTSISYSSDKASISSVQYYWGSTSNNAYDIWSIKGATNSQAGLMSASDKSKLDGIDLSTKQDTLVSGTNIKTVNGISLLGEGNITISGEGGADLSGYYTKAEIDEMIGGASNTITEINK